MPREMKPNTRPITAFNRLSPVTKKPAPCLERKIHRIKRDENEAFITRSGNTLLLPNGTKNVNYLRRKSAPELPPISPNRNSSSTSDRRHSTGYVSVSSSKSYLARSLESRGSATSVITSSSPAYDSNTSSDKHALESFTSTKLWITTDVDDDLHENAKMSKNQKKEGKKYRSRLSSKDHSTTSGNNNSNYKQVLVDKQTDCQMSPLEQFSRSKTFTKSVKKKTKGQKRNSKASLVNNRTLSIENIDQLTRSKTLDNEPSFGLRRSSSTHALNKMTPIIVKTDHENGNVEETSDLETDPEFDEYIMNWIKNVESAGLEPPPDQKIEYLEEPPQKDTAVHIVHDS